MIHFELMQNYLSKQFKEEGGGEPTCRGSFESVKPKSFTNQILQVDH